jgi:hypothetical protein
MEAFIGLLSSAVATTLVHPIDVVKVKYQDSVYYNRKLTSTNITKNIYNAYGVRGFYRGLAPRLLTFPTFYSVYYQAEHEIKKHVKTENKIADRMITSYSAGAIGSVVANPFYVMATKMQIYGKQQSSISLLKKMITKSGPSSLFKGLPITLLNNTKLMIQFPLKDTLYEDYGWRSFTSSLMGKIAPLLAYYPLDLIRTIQRDSIEPLKMSQAVKSVYKVHGFKGFYRGIILYNMVSTTNFIVLNMIRDSLRNLDAFQV